MYKQLIQINKAFKTKKKLKKIDSKQKIKKNTFKFFITRFNQRDFLESKFFFVLMENFNNKINRKITCLFNNLFLDKKAVNLNFVNPNDLTVTTKSLKTTSNDIVQGIPKLNSLLENSYNDLDKSTNRFKLNSFSVRYKDTSLFLTNDSVLTNKKKNKNKLNIENKNNLIENLDPENFMWYLHIKMNCKIDFDKNIFYNISKTKRFITNSLQKVYKEQNIFIVKKTFETIINTMFSRIIIISPLYNPFNINEKIQLKLYLKLLKTSKTCKFIPPLVLPFIEGISKGVYESGNLLSAISFRDAITNITKKCLFGSKDWLTTIKANLLIGQQLNIGSNYRENINKYIITKDYLSKIKL